MQQGFDPNSSWLSMTEQFRRVFGDDFVQNLMKSMNLSELMSGGMGSMGGGAAGRPGTGGGGTAGAAQGGGGSSGIPGMGGLPGMAGIPGFPAMSGFPFGGQGGQAGGGASSGAPPGSSVVVPRADVIQTRHEVVVWLELPGAEPGDVKIQASQDSLHVRGNLRRPYAVQADDQVATNELFRGEFRRDIPLPVRVKSEKVRANYRQGLLEVRMLKAEPEAGPRGQDVPIRFD